MVVASAAAWRRCCHPQKKKPAPGDGAGEVTHLSEGWVQGEVICVGCRAGILTFLCLALLTAVADRDRLQCRHAGLTEAVAVGRLAEQVAAGLAQEFVADFLDFVVHLASPFSSELSLAS